jgi:hypothetical protein
MTLVTPDVGEVEILECAFKDASPEALNLKLYSNNYDPVKGSVAGNFTELSGGGYAQKALTRAGWSSAVPGSPSSISYATQQTFSFTGAVNVVGYYLVGAVSGNVYWAERLYAGAGQPLGDGEAVAFTPKITFASVSND